MINTKEVKIFVENCKDSNRLTTEEFILVKAYLKHTHQYSFEEFLKLHNLEPISIDFMIRDCLIEYTKSISNTPRKYSWSE